MNGAERIAAERQRQIDVEGYTPEHDAHHDNEALAFAAACLAAPQPIFCIQVREGADQDGARHGTMNWHEPWPTNWKRDTWLVQPRAQRIRELEKAGAMIAAEIDRLLAQEGS